MNIQEIQMWQKIQLQDMRLTSQNENRVNLQPEAIKNWMVAGLNAGKRFIETSKLFQSPITEPSVCACSCENPC
jgi:hypothetical protein